MAKSSESQRRVVVTGTGVVSCLGCDVDRYYQRLLKGESGIIQIRHFATDDLPVQIGGVVSELDAESWIERKLLRRIDPAMTYGLVAAKKALLQAGILGNKELFSHPSRYGCILGSGMGGMNIFLEGYQTLLEKGFRRVSPFFIPYSLSNMIGALLAIETGFQGPNYSISAACATANYCILNAFDRIRQNECDLVVCGAAEAPVGRAGIAGFAACHALSQRNEDPTHASRPWDQERDGFVLSEGAGVLVLEELEHARRRGATILAELLGGATNCDAYHMTEPMPDGGQVYACMKEACEKAAISPDQIDYINAHATSTPLGDRAEAVGIRRLLGHALQRVKVNATKSWTGHSLAASGGLEAIATVEALRTGWLHPTANLSNPDSCIDEMDCCIGEKVFFEPLIALTNSFGFGGHNSTLVFAKHSP